MPMPFRGALLNTLTVLLGSLLGLGVGTWLPASLQSVAMSGIGLVTVGIGIKMFLETKNVLVIAAAIALGGVIGKSIGIDVGLETMSEAVRTRFGGADHAFNEGLVGAVILFCVGPMTIMGCIQDGIERRIDLLSLKSLLDGVSSVFLAAASQSYGQGVLASAAFVLLVQSTLTALARPLKPLVKNPNVVAEATAAGGAMLVAIGLGLLKVQMVEKVHSEVYLPALVLAPAFAALFEKKKPAA